VNAISKNPEYGFPKDRRLLRHADFDKVYQGGRRHFSRFMTVFYLGRTEERPQGVRIGLTVGKVLGGAVQRNRMKRRLREAIRLRGPRYEMAADVVINPKRSLLNADFTDIQNEVAKAFEVIEKNLGEKNLGKEKPRN
jgi:ribonuclease P protein component